MYLESNTNLLEMSQMNQRGDRPCVPCGMSLKYEFTADQIIEEGRVSLTDIENVRMWMKVENFPKATDEQIVLFLLSCDNDIEKTKITITAYYKTTYVGRSLFNDRDIQSKELIDQSGTVESCLIPTRTKDNYVVAFQRFKNFSYWNFHLETSMKYLFMTIDLGLQANPPNGLTVLFDMKGMGLMHLTKLRVAPLRIFFSFIQEGLPVQVRAIHVLNSAYFVDKLLAIIKPFMKKELVDKLHFHPEGMNMEEFFKNHIEAECVPADYGGKLPPVKILEEISIEKLKQLTQWFATEEAIRKQYKPPK